MVGLEGTTIIIIIIMETAGVGPWFWFQTSEIESHVCLCELGVAKSTEARVKLDLNKVN